MSVHLVQDQFISRQDNILLVKEKVNLLYAQSIIFHYDLNDILLLNEYSLSFII